MDIAPNLADLKIFTASEMVRQALNIAIACLREARMAQPPTAENPHETAYELGRFRGVMDCQANLNKSIQALETMLDVPAPNPDAPAEPCLHRYRPAVMGVMRSPGQPTGLVLALTDIATDADIRSLHEFLRFWVPE